MAFLKKWADALENYHRNQLNQLNSTLKNMEEPDKVTHQVAEASAQFMDFYRNLSQQMFEFYGQENQSLNVEKLNALYESNPLTETLLENIARPWEVLTTRNTDSTPENLEAILNPSAWLKMASTQQGISLAKYTQVPTSTTFGKIDKKILRATDSWNKSNEKTLTYYRVILNAWQQSFERFVDELRSMDSLPDQDISARQIIDLWTDIAGKELEAMNKSEEFLVARRDIIQASMQYKNDERHVAEEFCKIFHIPTRSEVDSLHKTLTELKREFRKLNRQMVHSENLPSANAL